MLLKEFGWEDDPLVFPNHFDELLHEEVPVCPPLDTGALVQDVQYDLIRCGQVETLSEASFIIVIIFVCIRHKRVLRYLINE